VQGNQRAIKDRGHEARFGHLKDPPYWFQVCRLSADTFSSNVVIQPQTLYYKLKKNKPVFPYKRLEEYYLKLSKK
jgi:hypothetical protein